jgi:hypothetical protein
MKKITTILVASAVGLALSCCGGSSTPTKTPTPASNAAPAAPADYQAAAEKSLGSETNVLLYGDLAKNGHVQVLAANELKVTPEGVAPGTLVMRAALIENDNGSWKEIFRCDEHLQNTKGFLGGIPLAPVNGWRLQTEQDPVKGLEMYFTPLAKPAGGYVQTIGVRWNPKTERYQSLDRNFQDFLIEVPALETPESQIR